jgi:hypothetical protein
MPKTNGDPSRPLSHGVLHRTLAYTIAAVFLAPAHAQEDTTEIVRRALRNNADETEIRKQYTYVEREEERKLDGSGAVKSRESHTWDVTQGKNGRQNRKLIQHNDRDLTPKEEKQELARLQKRRQNVIQDEERRHETAEQRQQRLQAAKERREKQDQKQVDDIIASYDLRLVGDDQIDGIPVWVIEGTPRPNYKFQDSDLKFMSRIKGRIWISKTGYQPVRIEAESTDTIGIGGIVARIQSGSRILAEFTRVNDEVWLPKHFTVSASARILLVKGLHEEFDTTFTNYKKFSAASKVIE